VYENGRRPKKWIERNLLEDFFSTFPNWNGLVFTVAAELHCMTCPHPTDIHLK
jgi:hypothetical protein